MRKTTILMLLCILFSCSPFSGYKYNVIVTATKDEKAFPVNYNLGSIEISILNGKVIFYQSGSDTLFSTTKIGSDGKLDNLKFKITDKNGTSEKVIFKGTVKKSDFKGIFLDNYEVLFKKK